MFWCRTWNLLGLIVIPGRCEASNPESRDSGSGANAPSRNDGVTLAMTRVSVGSLGVADQRRLLDVVLRKDLLQVLDLRDVVEGNIGLVRVQRQVVLMIVFRRIEPLQRADLGHDRLLVDLGGVELGDIGLRHLLLLIIGSEDRRTILRTGVRALAVQLRRVMHHGKEYLQDLAIADL